MLRVTFFTEIWVYQRYKPAADSINLQYK